MLPTPNANGEGTPSVRPPPALVTAPGADEASTASEVEVPPVVSLGPADAGPSSVVADAGPSVDAGPAVVAPPQLEPCAGLTFGTSCYEVFDSFLTWDAAEQSCVAAGGHLASIGSPEENVALDAWPALLGITGADGSGVWVGATDFQRDAVFAWTDGSPLTFLAWASGQPDNGAGVDCIEKRSDGLGAWYDRRCADALRYLCERPL